MNLTSEFSDLWISLCWQLTALIVIATILGMTLLRHRPHLMNVLWIIVFVKALTIPLWSSPTSLFSWIEPHQPQPLIEIGFLSPAPSPLAGTPVHVPQLASTHSASVASVSTARLPTNPAAGLIR